jgi:hypothetical protein
MHDGTSKTRATRNKNDDDETFVFAHVVNRQNVLCHYLVPTKMSFSSEINLLEPLLQKAKTERQREFAQLESFGLVEWLFLHHFPTKIRKFNLPICVTSPSRGKLLLQIKADDYENELDCEMWKRGVRMALKKVVVEDLGNLKASELEATIPFEDPEGRGMKDLKSLEKKLAIKVTFDKDTGHVLLIGDKKKLEKKVFVIRNMISHYHWRLFGTDVAFDQAN